MCGLLFYHERSRIAQRHNSLHGHVFFMLVLLAGDPDSVRAETRYTGILIDSAWFAVLAEAGPLSKAHVTM